MGSEYLRRLAGMRLWCVLLVCVLPVSAAAFVLHPVGASSTPDFKVSDNVSALAIPVASERQSTVRVDALNGFSGNVTLVATPSSGAVSCWFDTLTNTAILRFPNYLYGPTVNYQYPTCTGGPAGSYNLTITGTSGSLTHSIVLPVNITDFSISGPPSVSFTAGSIHNQTITVSSLYGLSGLIPLRVTSPRGFSASCPSSVAVSTGSVTAIKCPLASPTSGTYNVTVTGTFECNDCYHNGIDTRSYTIVVDVTGPSVPGFSISSSSIAVTTGYPSSTTVTLTSLNGFSGPISLTTMAPENLTATAGPTTIQLAPGGNATSTLSVASSDCEQGDYSVLLTGSNGSTSYFTNILVSVTPQNPWNGYGFYTACASPISVSIAPGSVGTSTINLARQNKDGYVTGMVNLAASISPSSSLISCQVSPSSLNLTSIDSMSSTLSCSSSTPGNYTVYVTARWNPPFQCNSPSCIPPPDSSSTTRAVFIVDPSVSVGGVATPVDKPRLVAPYVAAIVIIVIVLETGIIIGRRRESFRLDYEGRKRSRSKTTSPSFPWASAMPRSETGTTGTA